MTDVLVVGGVGVDHIVRVPELPAPFADSVMVPPILSYVGHTGNGVALGCRALGLATRMVDVIGDDPEGGLVRRTYAEAGLDFTGLVHPSGTRRSVNLVSDDGRRMSFYDPRHPFEFVPDARLWREGLDDTRHVHVSIMNWARHALADAVAAGISTSTDLHDWDGHNDYHRDFALGADLVFVSAAALADVESTVHHILDNGRARAVVVMDGARGSLLAQRDTEWVQVTPVTIEGRPVVDSNGAGDSYVAAFLARVLAGDPLDGAAAAGSFAGAWACGSAGTHTSFVDPARVDEFLLSRFPDGRPRPRLDPMS